MRKDRPGKVIAGRYELLEPAGEGGMAVVWRAIARGAGQFARHVAVKRIHAGKGGDQSFVRLFEEEARVGAALQHPNIVHILDFGVDDEGDYFLVMEWIEGLDLHQWVRAHPRAIRETPWPIVTAIGIEVLRGLGAAHERRDASGELSPVFHRDVSPSNILLGVEGAVKLTDFGLARAMDRASMTRPNVIKGKLAYCAPELITGAKASASSDVFAVGVCLWESLAQQRLFTGKNDLEVLLSVRKGEIQPLRELRHDIPGALELAIQQSLEPDPKNRFESAKAMARALTAILRDYPEPIDAEPIGQSVREARERLGLARKAGEKAGEKAGDTAGKGIDKSIEVSVSDLEVIDAPPADEPIASSDLSLEPLHPQPPVRGLWKSDPSTKK
ncbi:MAG: serine/threonine protein kinase [Sandaracinaceae bacterium]|nr:serine/threonine protein kinase [Sandaracinaceae bacterium]